MAERDKSTFKGVCFAVLMQGNGGIINKAPAYVSEKYDTAINTCFAWRMLDANNQAKVRGWAEMWRFPLDEILREFGEE